MNRREALKLGLGAAGAVVAAPMINLDRYRLFAGVATEYSKRAVKLVTESTVIDMLSPFYISDSLSTKQLTDPDSWGPEQQKVFKESGINVFHIAVGTGSFEGAHQFVALWDGFIAAHDEHVMRVDSAADLERVKRSG
ncbi:MAG TPA: hypothetical protein VFQ38_13045, partial [Longimicrobiales bacterium]|nr:hypothetical protein [Longimicrobiales bacterium]